MSLILRRVGRDLTLARRVISACSHFTSSAVDGSLVEKSRSFVAERAAYNKEMSDLRKKFAKEIFERQREKVAAQKRKVAEEMALAKQRRKEKQEVKAAARPQLGELERREKEEREAQRREREEHRLSREMKIQKRREERLEELRSDSGSWIELQKLESRINEALASPDQI